MRILSRRLLALLTRHWFWIILALMAVTWVLWTLHYQALVPGLNVAGRWARAALEGLFATLQFLVLNKSLDEDLATWQWWILASTQLLIPLFASLALISALLREHFEPIWQKLALSTLTQDGFWVVVGSGSLSRTMVASLTAAGKTVLVIDGTRSAGLEPQGDNHYLQRDIAANQTFLGVPVHRAAAIVLDLPDENDNLRVLQDLGSRLGVHGCREPVRVHCAVHSHDLLRMFMDQPGLDVNDIAQLDIRPLHLPMLCAREVVTRFSPDRYDTGLPERQRTVTVVIVGTCAVARALLVRLARIGVFSPQGRLDVVWVGDGVDAALGELTAQYPALAGAVTQDVHAALRPVPLLPFLSIRAVPGRLTRLLQADTEHMMAGAAWPSIVYVAHDSAAQTLADARELQVHAGLQAGTAPPRPIVAIMQGQVLRPATLPLSESHWRFAIHVLEADRVIAANLMDDSVDAMAKSYDAIWSSATRIDVAAWRNHHFVIKESNRDIADHLASKLRYAGLGTDAVDAMLDPDTPLGTEQREALQTRLDDHAMMADLVRMEQQRYRAFMALNGFRAAGQGAALAADVSTTLAKQVDRALRVNATLGVPLADLSPEEVCKDENIIRHTVTIMGIAKQAASGRPRVT